MIKVGFIGYGSMGSMLIEAFINSKNINPDEIIVSTKTKNKLDSLKTRYSDISIANSNSEVAQKAKYVFICVKPLEVKDILREIKDSISYDSNIISIAGPVKIAYIEQITGAKVTKLTPSLTSEVMEGISLVCHSNIVTKEESDYIETLLNGISKVKIIKEEDFELAAELTSCMPGFISSIIEEMVESALRHTSSLGKADIEEMVIRTMFGTSKVLIEKNMGLSEMLNRVATKGGITEEGVKVFRQSLPNVFDEMFEATLSKRKLINKKIEQSIVD
jgi:pyrroline-5-carboxylate reductase